jgi:hypothetical protein
MVVIEVQQGKDKKRVQERHLQYILINQRLCVENTVGQETRLLQISVTSKTCIFKPNGEKECTATLSVFD